MPRVPITDDIRKELNALHKKTKIGPQRLLKGKKDRPEGLQSTTIYHWMNGKTVSAKQNYLEWVLKEWRTTKPLLNISPTMHKQLLSQCDRTGMSPSRFCNMFTERPEGLTKRLFIDLRCLNVKTVEHEIWKFVIASLQTLPDKEISIKRDYIGLYNRPEIEHKSAKLPILKNKPDDYVRLTKTAITRLKRERKRTGVEATELLRRFEDEKPDKLSSSTISSWITGQTIRASKSRLQWVLDKWESLPNA